MRPSFSHSSDTSHNALSLTGSGSSCSSVGTSIIALVALKNLHTSQKRISLMHTALPQRYGPMSLPCRRRSVLLPSPFPPSPHTPRPVPRRARRPLSCHPSSIRALHHSLRCTCHSGVCLIASARATVTATVVAAPGGATASAAADVTTWRVP